MSAERLQYYNIDGIRAELRIKPIKNMYIRVYPPDGKVVVSAPSGISKKALSDFLNSKSRWIREQHLRLSRMSAEKRHEFVSGEYHLYEGKRYRLEVRDSQGRTAVCLDNENIIMYINRDATKEVRERALDAWYREGLKQKLPLLVSKWEKVMDLDVAECRIRKMRTKWGTCNTRERRIWISLELAKYPVFILEYITVHEMVHLLERKHNKRFYALMDHFLPEWREGKKYLLPKPE